MRPAALLLAAALGLAACSSEPVTRSTTGTTDTPEAPASPGATATDPSGDDTATEGPTTPAFAQDLTNLGSTRDEPLAIGQAVRVGEWEVRVVGYDPDATAEVLAFNDANPDPPDGEVFALARLEATFVGEAESANAFLENEWALVDDAGELHTDADCGVLPDDLASQSGVPRGQTANGTVCFAVPQDLLDQVVLYVAPLLGPETTRRWWQADPDGAGTVLSSTSG